MHIKILPSLYIYIYIYIYIFVCIVEALTGTINDWVIKFTVTKFKKKKVYLQIDFEENSFNLLIRVCSFGFCFLWDWFQKERLNPKP